MLPYTFWIRECPRCHLRPLLTVLILIRSYTQWFFYLVPPRENRPMNTGCNEHCLSSKLTVSALFVHRFSRWWDHQNFARLKSQAYNWEVWTFIISNLLCYRVGWSGPTTDWNGAQMVHIRLVLMTSGVSQPWRKNGCETKAGVGTGNEAS